MTPARDDIQIAAAHAGRDVAHAGLLFLLLLELARVAAPDNQILFRARLLLKAMDMMAKVPLKGVSEPDLVRAAAEAEVQYVLGNGLN